MSIDELTAADLLEGVEIYDSYAVIPRELPVYSHPCGVVAFWSRRDVHTRVTTWQRIVLGLAAGAAILPSAL